MSANMQSPPLCCQARSKSQAMHDASFLRVTPGTESNFNMRDNGNLFKREVPLNPYCAGYLEDKNSQTPMLPVVTDILPSLEILPD